MSFYIDGKYQCSGIFDHSKIKDKDKRFEEMAKSLCRCIEEWKPDVVVFEDTDLQTNAAVMKRLSQMQGIIMGACIAANLPYFILKPSVWRSGLGFEQGPKVKREELKVQAVNWVRENLGLNLPEDQAEAVCIGAAFGKMMG